MHLRCLREPIVVYYIYGMCARAREHKAHGARYLDRRRRRENSLKAQYKRGGESVSVCVYVGIYGREGWGASGGRISSAQV